MPETPVEVRKLSINRDRLLELSTRLLHVDSTRVDRVRIGSELSYNQAHQSAEGAMQGSVLVIKVWARVFVVLTREQRTAA